jgi:multimeric flavodoxin WrbA
MRITVFNGSPRRERGNTHFMVSEFLKGAQDAGAEAESIFLAGKEIRSCTGCYSCWTSTPGKCVQADDMKDLLDRFRVSDLVVFATPLYVDNVTGLMKNFIDRLITYGDPHMELDELGECRHVKRHEKPAAMAVISNCGYPEQSHFQVLRILFTRMARNFHCNLIAEIYRGGGGILTSTIPAVREAVEKYRMLLRTAGREVATLRGLSTETKQELEKPLTPLHADTAAYIQAVNRMWDARLAEIHKGN